MTRSASSRPDTAAELTVWRGGSCAVDAVAEEVPVALRYNGRPHVVMMCTPSDLEEFARGFSVTEGLVEQLAEIGDVRVHAAGGVAGFEIDISIPAGRAAALDARQRNLQGRSGCGLCGAQEIEEAARPVRTVGAGAPVQAAALRRALDALSRQQPLNAATGATHAAAWATPDGLLVAVREDVGRHNALDKLIGALLMAGTDLECGFVLLTSRASYEMVHKAASVGMPMVVAISAPTAYAVRIAEQAGLTLVGFARGDSHAVYAGAWRLLHAGACVP